MYAKYEVNGADSFGENFQKPRNCTDGSMEGQTLKGDQAENRVPVRI